MTAREHMSWCVGKHDGWDCIIKQALRFGHKSDGYGATVVMSGVPCDGLAIAVDTGAMLGDPEELDGYVRHLYELAHVLIEMREPFAASQSEADCDDSHDHG